MYYMIRKPEMWKICLSKYILEHPSENITDILGALPHEMCLCVRMEECSKGQMPNKRLSAVSFGMCC